MYLKKFKKSIFMLLLLIAIIPINALAYSNRIIASGQSIGISLNSNGILIVGTYQVNNTSPAQEAGLKTGDIIEKINNTKVSTIEDMANEILNDDILWQEIDNTVMDIVEKYREE